MSKYRIRTLEEKGGRECVCVVCVCIGVRAAKIRRALRSHGVQSGERVPLSSARKGVILPDSTGRLQIRSVRLSRKSLPKETSKN